ncbi:Uu.00g078550.m01.CDS01 [Anthostomella pinea]|uniref:Uu.00g078550.m01.CDS01 n=1 Tax=Anthostomella pinea TaxID=933095 RepID=A0AAI8VKK7_9PEZI|nr:Uu.00g078550.m01.CDS01 [Anthostomella pinea]
MYAARTTTRAAIPRAARAARAPRVHNRFQSTTSSSSNTSNAGPSSNTHFAAGLAGGVAGGALLYGIFLLTPSGKMHRTINKGATEASKKYYEATKKLQETTPDVDGAMKYIKEFCYSYVSWVPGGRQYVDTVFKDVDILRENHQDEVNKIISDAYKQMLDLSKSGLSMETASKAYDVLADISKKLGSLAGDALDSILDNHPQLKQKFGGSIDQLKEMGDQYGPEAKKQVDETWQQVKDVMGGGLSAANLDKARRLIEEKVEQVKKLGDEAWKKGLEQAKPYLDKNPKVKELVENNADALKQGNAKELFDKAKDAVNSGNMGGFEDYVNNAVEKAKKKGSQTSSSFGLDQYFNMIPNGSEILGKVNQLREVAEKHKDEGEKLLKETMDELKQVLEKKSKKAEEIADKAKKDAK